MIFVDKNRFLTQKKLQDASLSRRFAPRNIFLKIYRLFEFGNSAVTSAVAVIMDFDFSLALSPALSELVLKSSLEASILMLLMLECSSKVVQGRILIRPRAVA